MRGRDEPRLVGAELADPPVVGLRVRLGQRRVVELGLPQQPDGGVEDRRVDVLGVEHVDPLPRVHRAVRRLADVGAGGILHHRRQVRRTHRAERGGEAAPAELGPLPADLELLEAVLVDHDAQRPVAELGVDVGLPQVGWLEDVPVGVDGAVEGDGMGLVDRLAGRDGDRHRVEARTALVRRSHRSVTAGVEHTVPMARVPYPDPATLDPNTQAFLDRLPPLNVFRMLAGGEGLLAAFARFGNHLLYKSMLDPVLREIAIIRVGVAVRRRLRGLPARAHRPRDRDERRAHRRDPRRG